MQWLNVCTVEQMNEWINKFKQGLLSEWNNEWINTFILLKIHRI